MHRRRAWPSTLLATTTVVVVAAVAGAVAPDRGRTEAVRAASPAPPSSEIAFSFGGRILVMRADGSGRSRLTGGRAARRAVGDDQPAWSPDATRLAFVRSFVQPDGDSRSQLYLLDPDRGRPRPFTAADPVAVFDPAWSPDGRRIAFVRWTLREDGFETALVVADVDGSAERVLRSALSGDVVSLVREPAWSPDGSRIAYTLTRLDKRYYFRPSLYAMGADGGEAKLLAAEAADAAWSPDGRRIAFTSVRDRNGKSCYEMCNYKGELYVTAADGTNLVRLTRNRGDDRSPSWSPDGRRIAFMSDRNYPRGVGSEIYTVRPDGSCLTWLTNGTPQSRDPTWRNAPGTSRSPGRCRATRRAPLVEVDTRRLREHERDPVYWLGKRYGDLLLGSAEVSRDGPSRSYYFHYDDCSRYEPRACPPGLQLQEVSVCSRSGQSTLPVLDQRRYRHPVRAFAARGLLFVDIGQGDLGVIIGRAHVRIFPGVGGRRGRRQLLAAVKDLRPFGKQARRLPPPALPRALLQRLRRTERA